MKPLLIISLILILTASPVLAQGMGSSEFDYGGSGGTVDDNYLAALRWIDVLCEENRELKAENEALKSLKHVRQFQSVTELTEWVDNLEYAEVIQAFSYLNDGRPSFPVVNYMGPCPIAVALQLHARNEGYLMGLTQIGDWHLAGLTIIGYGMWIVDYNEQTNEFFTYPKGFIAHEEVRKK